MSQNLASNIQIFASALIHRQAASEKLLVSKSETDTASIRVS